MLIRLTDYLATIGSYFKKLCTVITRNQSECNAKCFCHKGSIPTRRTYGQTDEHNCIKRQTRPNNLSRFYALYWWKLLSYTKDPNKQKKRKAEMLKVHSKNTNVLFFIFWHHHCPRYLKAARWALNRFMYWLALPTRNGSVYPLGLLSSDRFYSCSMSVYPIKTITIMMTSMISILFMNVVFFYTDSLLSTPI